jgi:ligand-binding SRPBCC domain-containing protein
VYTLEREVTVRAGLDEVWRFLSNPANLNTITPPDLHFRIISAVPQTMYNGLLIEYRIHIPLFGRRRWLAEIKHIRPLHSFVDEQRIGPYRFWYHYHELTVQAGRVRIRDRVSYAPPYGPLGHILHFLFIRRTLQRIFSYRQQRLAELFGQ